MIKDNKAPSQNVTNTPPLSGPVKYRPATWERLTGIRILDADGWREPNAKEWETPITKEEWNKRMMVSTISAFSTPSTSSTSSTSSTPSTRSTITGRAPQKRKEESTSGDKKAIWTDCPHCARKHLLAAYALLTQDGGPKREPQGAISVNPFRLLLSRAKIALVEAQTGGYVGNASLASGCLAAAECFADHYLAIHQRHELRDVRMAVEQMNFVAALTELSRLMPVHDCEASAAAHLVEARRELVQISIDAPGEESGWHNGGYYHDCRGDVCAWIVKTVRQIEIDYELGAGS